MTLQNMITTKQSYHSSLNTESSPIKNVYNLSQPTSIEEMSNKYPLIKKDSYICNDDNNIILNTITTKTRNNKNNKNVRKFSNDETFIPFHASKHSQIVPFNDLDLSSNIRHLSINSLPIDNNNNNDNITLNSKSYISNFEINGSKKNNDITKYEINKMRNYLKRNKEMKRKRKTFIMDDDRVLIGNKVSEGHVNFIIAYNMLTGIRVAVSRCSGIMKPLTLKDFNYNKKLTFDYHGNELTPSSQYAFKFKDYSPEVFRELRSLFGLDPADYLVSLTSKYILSELNSPGKSGSFFYYSRDYKYIIKTIHHSEHIHLRRHLKEYYNHVKSNPDTLLCQFYGLHRVKMPISFQNKIKHRKIYFIVMNNLFPPHLEIHKTYDLKGSTWGRRTDIKQLSNNDTNTNYHQVQVLKDLNWLDTNETIKFGPLKKKKFLNQLQTDIALLSKLNIMDYSLLIGIHDLKKDELINLTDEEIQDLIIGSSENPILETNDIVSNVTSLDNPQTTSILHTDNNNLIAQQEKRPGRNYEVSKVVSHFFKQYEGGIRSSDAFNNDDDYIYYIGIIDCLTNYSIVKKLETFWRSLNHDRNLVSAIPPRDYGQRLYDFIENSLESNTKFKPYKDKPRYKDSSIT